MAELNIYHYFLYKSNYIYRAILLMLLFVIVYLFIKENGKAATGKIKELFKQGWIIGFLFYLALILTATIFARKVETPYRNIIGKLGFQEDVEWNFEIVMNLLLFIPYTFLFLEAFHPSKIWMSSLMLSVATTFFIEFSQLLFWLGECQLSDILYNIIGGMIGCGLYYVITKKALIRLWKWFVQIINGTDKDK